VIVISANQTVTFDPPTKIAGHVAGANKQIVNNAIGRL
jgi:hypothetical protein